MTTRYDAGALERLGARLRATREAAGLTGSELAGALGPGWAQPKISKIENGRQLPTETEVTAWAAAVGADAAPLAALRDDAAAGADDLRPLAPETFTHLAVFQPVTVPALLQTAAYVRHRAAAAILAAGDTPTAETLGHIIAAEVRGQAVLYEPGRTFVHVVTEAALRLRIGAMTISTLRGQLLHLAELATLPGHTFGVLPFDRACPVPLSSAFTVYDRELVRVETPGGTVEQGAADRYVALVERLVDAAVTGPAAAEACRSIAAALPD